MMPKTQSVPSSATKEENVVEENIDFLLTKKLRIEN
jgi:hypothetical protein